MSEEPKNLTFMKRMSLASLLNLKKVLTAIAFLFVSTAFLTAQTTFTATASGNWSEAITWTKAGPSLAGYPGEPGYESEVHDVVINGAGIIVTLDIDITSSIRNVTLTTGTLDISASTITMTGNLSGGSTLTFSSGRINIAGDNTSTGTFNTGIGTVSYNGATQIVRGTTYYNLEISGTNTKTVNANTVVSNDLTIYSGQLETANRNFSVNNGTTTIFTGGEFTANSITGIKSFRNVVLSGGTLTSTSATAETMNISGTLVSNNNATSTLGDITTLITGSSTVAAGATLSFGTGGSKTFEGQVVINGSWDNTSNEDITFFNGLTVNGTSFISGTGTYTFSNNSQSIQGSLPITFDGAVAIGTMTLTNSTNVTIKGTLTGGNPSTWRNANGSVLNYENAAAPMDGGGRILNASANSNLVNYSGNGAQAIKGATYYNLTTSASGTKTLQAAITVNHDLSITGSTVVLTNQYQITGTAGGDLTMDSGTSLLLGNPSSATAVTFPANFVTANISLDPNSTVSYQANTAQTISAAPVYGNLSTATSGIKTLANDIIVSGNLIIGTNTTLSTGAGNYDISLAGSWTSNGTFTENQGKVTFNGTGAQSITNTLTGTETFYDLEFNSAGPVTSDINLAATNTLTMTQGVILMPGRTFLLGTGAATPGTLAYSSGWITGTFSRWASTTHNGTDLIFPVGDNSYGRNFTLNYSGISAAGILSVNFVSAPPTTSGLPLFEDLYVFNVLFPEGYWHLTKDALFAYAGTFDLDIVPAGFTTYPIDGNTRILSRLTASDWLLNGTHVAGSSALLQRAGLSTFTNDYAIAPADLCTPSFIGCPGDVVVNNAPGICGNTVSWTAPTMDIACLGFAISNNYNPGDNFNIGITQVAYYIMKGTARIDSCKFNVVVNDNELPVVICRNINLYLDATGSAILTGAAIDNGSSDNCSLALATDRANFNCSDAGLTIPVQLTGTDPSGNSAVCTAQVTVLDTISPVINIKTTTLILDATGNATLPASAVDNGTTDNCSLDTIYVSPDTFTCADLGPQTVTLHARDVYGNSSSASVVITIESSLTINSTSLSNCDLAVTYALYKSDVAGGDGNYTYFWDGLDDSVDPFVTVTGTFPFLVFSNTSTLETPFFNNLMPDGTYTVRLTVTDQGGFGCTDSFDMIIVKSGLVFNNVTVRYSEACEGTVVSYSMTEDPDATYNWGVQNGTILTSPLDTSRIDVQWNVGVSQGVVISTSQKINILGDPCESTVVDTVTINPLPAPVFNSPATNVCYNSIVTYNLTLPYADYTWTVSGGTITAGGNGSDYVTVRWGTGPAGRVTSLVETAAGCSASTFVDINIYNLAGSLTALTDVTCNGANDGQVTVTATAGTGMFPYVYSLDGNPFVASGTFSGIAPGAHVVTIRDALMCTFDVSFTITQPVVLSASVTKVNIACFGGSTGSITATATGGTSPYEYSLDGGAYQASGIFTGLTSGNHMLAVRDSKLCIFNQNINLTQPAAALAASVSITDVACFGGSTGAVNLTVTGGTTPYTFLWSNGATTEDISGLAAGIYSVIVTDANLCTTNTSATVNQSPALVATASNNSPVCIGDPLTLTGGPNGMTTYAWTGPDGFTSFLQSPLVSASATLAMDGVYTLTVTSGAGCTDTETTTVTVTPDNTINLSSAVGTDNQSICINEALVTINYITTGATNATFLNLPSGVTGSWAANIVTISGTPTVTGSFTYTVTLTGGCGTATTNGTIDVAPENTISMTSGFGTDNQTVCINTAITDITYSTNGATGASFSGLPSGVTGSWSGDIVTITGAPSASGSFNYIVTLLGGCGTITETGTISVTPDNTYTLTSGAGTNNQMVCNNSAITDITYTTTGATGATFSGLPAGVSGSWASDLVTISGTPTATGTYNYAVELTGGCGTVTANGTITVSTDNTINLTSGAGTDAQTVCVNTPITGITYATLGATGATVSGLPAGVTGAWAANVVTISGSPTVPGTSNYTVTLTGGCGSVSTGGTINSSINNTITLTSGAGTDNQTICLGNAITAITYVTTGATGASFTGLPSGMMVGWAANTVTISGTPTSTGTYSYTINLIGGCGTIAATGTIRVNPVNTIALTSGPGTNNQTTCINTAITNITYATLGATGATVSGLPAGVTGSWAANVVTISGTPSVSGSFTYTINLTGGCGTVPTTGTITVSPDNTVTLTSLPATTAQTVCINTAITDITYTTSIATGATVTGLPAGVTGSWAANTVTITGTPTVSGLFSYTVTLTGGCGMATAAGTILVSPDNTITLTSAAGTDAQTLCINTMLADITYATTDATGAGVSGLPAGVTGTWAADILTISGTPTAAGTFIYTVTLNGGCGTVTATGSISVTPDNTVSLSSPAGTDAQAVCINTAIADITYTTTGATGATVTGLPAGVTGSWAADVVTISGTLGASGIFNYTVSLSGGCGTATATGSITEQAGNTIILSSGAGTDAQTLCINNAITSITYSTTGATGATFSGLPAGVTGNWAADVVTISGTPTESGPFTYTVTLTGGCGTTAASGTIDVQPENTITLTSGPGTDNQTICLGDPIVPIIYTTILATGANFTGLPVGMTVAWAANVVTISGTPASEGVFTYLIQLTGGCGTVSTSGTITVLPLNTTTLTSTPGTDNQNTCINMPITDIAYTTVGATGASASGLPAGVTGTWASDIFTISGTPTVPGIFNYTVTLTGGCGVISAGGTITVVGDNTIVLSSAAGTDSQTICTGSPVTDITYATTGATGAIVTGLPSGLTGSWAADVVTITGTPAESGVFNYTVALSGGCGTVSANGTINITVPLPVSVSITGDANPVCAGTTVNFNATPVNPGTAPVYQWQINGINAGLNSNVFSYVPVNNDTVTVILTSSEVCTINNPDTSAAAVMTVNDLPVGSAVSSDVACFGQSTGSVDLTMTGGLLPMTYLWSNGAVTEDITGIVAGIYSVSVTDANNCTLVLSETINEPASAVSGTITSQTDVTTIGGNDGSVTVDGSGGTPPYLYSLSGGAYQASGTFSSLTAGNYTVTVQDINLCTFDVPVLIKQPFIPLDGAVVSQTDALCFGGATGSVTVTGIDGVVPYEYSLNGGTYQSSGTFTALAAGTYTVTIRDAYSNLYDVPVTIGQPAAALTVTTSKDDVNCNGGADGMAAALPSGGTGAYTYSWNTTPVQTADTARNLSPGTYTVTVTDANACIITGDVTIAEPAELTVETSSTLAKCPDSEDGSVTLDISGGTAPYSVIWENSDETGTSRNDLLPGTYNVVVTDANGCAEAATEEVGFVGTFECVVIPDLITPDPADGYNDEWIIRNIHIYPDAEIKIYSRWGKLIYHTKNPSADPWKGRYENGNLVPTDSYRYILDLHDGSKLRSGVISVIR